MKNHRIAALAVAASLLLSACATTAPPGSDPPPASTTAADAFHIVCAGVPVAHLAFQAVQAFKADVIDDTAIRWEAAVYGGLMNRCAGPVPDVSTLPAVIAEIQRDIGHIMEVVAAAKARAPAETS